jgi:myo-inositol-1(or 4)-monophosphatase
MQPDVTQITCWARGAGQILREGYGKRHVIDHKGRVDLVTEVDRLSEAYLIEQIRARFPTHTIFSEESGNLQGAGGDCWYIDPLDGTTNYAHHLPIFSVSLAYASPGGLQIGVVYDPMRDECFSAIAGQGAWLNGEPLRVSEAGALIHSLLVTGFPYDAAGVEKNFANFAHFTRLSRGVRRLGSAAIDLCYVASGRVDGYWEQSLQAYDMAAGALIAREAGARVTSLEGNEDILRPPFSVIAANPTIHALMLEEFQRG